jgi:hypothetical protein
VCTSQSDIDRQALYDAVFTHIRGQYNIEISSPTYAILRALGKQEVYEISLGECGSRNYLKIQTELNNNEEYDLTRRIRLYENARSDIIEVGTSLR